ncbi:cystatin-like [Denticeps clupeoides]|uniref:cystatin-like n=1 Tax=Denticeps clupeoides TaxID=299321 RepID=UPI0010A38464|nr:cystatin-like [Denticeps clupeoides]
MERTVLSLLVMAAATRIVEEDVDQSDPEVQACASFALESFNDSSHLYQITKFHSLKKQNIGAGQYDMDVEVMKCMKSGEAQVEGSCPVENTSDVQVFRCHFVVLSAPWKKQRVLIKSSCIHQV